MRRTDRIRKKKIHNLKINFVITGIDMRYWIFRMYKIVARKVTKSHEHWHVFSCSLIKRNFIQSMALIYMTSGCCSTNHHRNNIKCWRKSSCFFFFFFFVQSLYSQSNFNAKRTRRFLKIKLHRTKPIPFMWKIV